MVNTELSEGQSEKKNSYFFYGTLVSENRPYMMLLIHYFFSDIAKFEQLTDFTHCKIQ